MSISLDCEDKENRSVFNAASTVEGLMISTSVVW